MDIGNVILGTVLIVTCVAPFIWLNQIKKRAEKQLLKSLTDFAAEHDGVISRHETCRDMAIGLDEQHNRVFFYKKSPTEEVRQHIELAGIKSCKVINTSKSLRDKDNVRTVLEKLELSFAPAVENKPATVLEIYDMYKNVQPAGELDFAEQWAKWVNERLK